MKKILSMVLCVMLLAALAVAANAEAINMAGGCTTEVTIKKADSSVVVKDGVIGENEYTEVAVNRDPASTDLLYSWHPDSSLYASCEQFLNNVHFYFSWDEVNGLNMAIQATLLETPSCTAEQPADDAKTDGEGNTFPGDEFLFQFGAMFKINDGPDSVKSDIILYRGLGYNTDTDTVLTGHYGRHGYTGTYKSKVGENCAVKVNGNTVTYEISIPLADVLKAEELNGNAPVEDSVMYCDLTATGGSTGTSVGDAMCYAISLGDGGYMMSVAAGSELSAAKAVFTNTPIVENAGTQDTTAPVTTAPVTTAPDAPVTTAPVTTAPATSSVVSEEVKVTDTDGNVMTDEDGKDITTIVTSILTDAPTQDNNDNDVNSPVTGDPMVIAAVVAAISACGVVVAKKRK